MLRIYPLLILNAILLTFLACQQPKTEITSPVTPPINEEQKEEVETPLVEINLEAAKENGELPKMEKIQVAYDAVFKKIKYYEAIPLKPYLQKLISSQNLDTANTEIIFLCKDGYNPSMTLSKVMQYEPYLATRDLEAPNGEIWMDTLQGKWSPFYLVWINHSAGDKEFTWPYGLKYLQFKASDEAYKAAMPKDKSMVANFEVYKAKCMKCHSVNMVGGIMGPEMNVPKNITEYWKKEDIMAFVKNPYSYRYNSKMPPVEGITDQELEQLYAYLVYMKGQKMEME